MPSKKENVSTESKHWSEQLLFKEIKKLIKANSEIFF
jgi:hypothetical protein